MTGASDVVCTPRRALRYRPAWYLFLVAVTGASLLPIFVIPIKQHIVPDVKAAVYLVFAFNVLGAQFHVATTGWFYTDPVMRAFFWRNPRRYIIAPLAIIATAALVFALVDKTTQSYLVGTYLMWQLWHYQKQNFGLLSFVAAGTDRLPLSIWERRTLGVAFLPGALGFLRFFDIDLPDRAPVFLLAHQLGLACYALVVPCYAMAVIRSDALRQNPLRLAFFTYGTLFFLPTYLFPDAPSAIFGFALAHGLQYLVYMTVVSGRSPRPLPSLALLLAIAAGGHYLLTRAMAGLGLTSPYGDAIFGAALGVVMAHFVIDAGIWRMRESFQRGYMRAKFDFIFER